MNNRKSKFRFFAGRDPREFGYALYGMIETETTIANIQPVTLVSHPKDIVLNEESRPMMSRLGNEDLIELMDSLWRVGIRPSIGEGHIGELHATQEHLKDMKQIAFHKLGINEKQEASR